MVIMYALMIVCSRSLAQCLASDVLSPLPHSYSFTAESDTPPQASGLSTIVGEEAVFPRTGLANSPLLPLFPEVQFQRVAHASELRYVPNSCQDPDVWEWHQVRLPPISVGGPALPE